MKLIVALTARSSVSIFAAVVGLYIAAAESRTDNRIDMANSPRTGQVQVTGDDRRLIVDAQRLPYSAIGKFRGSMTCTAAIVLHPRIIVTAGHCITKNDGTLKLSNLLFQHGYQAGIDLGHLEATLWAVGSKQSLRRQSVHDASQDWAILVLDRAPTGVQPLLLSRRSSEAFKSLERQILMPSYSIDVANAERVSLDPACSVCDTIWDARIHDCRASFGSSGAPLLIRYGPQYAIVGIHAGSMFASDNERHIGKFVGYRAISSGMFLEELLILARHLDSDNIHNVASQTSQREPQKLTSR